MRFQKHLLSCIALLTALVVTVGKGSPHGGRLPVPSLRLPIQFTENRGQWASDVRYALLRGSDAAWFTRDGLVLTSSRQGAGMATITDGVVPASGKLVACLSFAGVSSRCRTIASHQTTRQSRFYYGKQPSRWVENAATFETVTYENVWDNIDVEYVEKNGRLRQTFRMHRGASPHDIRINYSGSLNVREAFTVQPGESTRLNGRTPSAVYSNGCVSIDGYSDILRDDVILVTEFSTFFGGSGLESLSGFDIDPLGNIFVLGATTSHDLPTLRSTQPTFQGGFSDLFVARFDPNGKTLSFSTYFGGSKSDTCMLWNGFRANWGVSQLSIMHRLKLGKGAGKVYICGGTNSPDFPITSNVVQRSIGTDVAGVISSFSREGMMLQSMYLGGPGATNIHSLSLDDMDNGYIGGMFGADSLWFVTKRTVQHELTNRPLRTYGPLPSGNDWLYSGGFIVKLTSDLDSVYWGSYFYALDGENFTEPQPWQLPGFRVLVDHHHNPIVIGSFAEPTLHNYPSYPRFVPQVNPIQDNRGVLNVFITKLDSSAERYVFSSYFGGSKTDNLWDVILNEKDDIIITGETESQDFPLVLPLQSTNRSTMPFIAKISSNGTPLASTYFGGTNGDQGILLDFDVCGNILLGGLSRSSDFPFVHASDTVLRSSGYAMSLSVFDPDCRKLLLSTFLNYPDGSVPWLQGVRSDAAGYLTGVAQVGLWADYYSVPSFGAFNAYQSNMHGSSDILVSRFRYPTCERVVCSILASDTLKQAARRRNLSTSRIAVTVNVENVMNNLPVKDVRVQLTLPDSIYLDPPFQSTLVSLPPPIFGPGMTASHTWTLRIDSTCAAPLNRTVEVTTMYTPDSGPVTPAPTEHCSLELPLLVYKEAEPATSCSIVADSAMVIAPEQTRYVNSPFTLAWSMHNEDVKPITISKVVLSAPGNLAVNASPAAGIARPGATVAPGKSYNLTWEIRADIRLTSRSIPLTVVAYDEWDASISQCQFILYAPGSDALPCRMDGPSVVSLDTSTYISDPDTVRCTTTMFNPLDSLQHIIIAEALPGTSGHLIPVGVPLVSDVVIPPKLNGVFQWKYMVKPPISEAMWDTAVVRYRTAAHPDWRWCSLPIRIVPASGMRCALDAPDVIGLTPDKLGYQPSPFDVRGMAINSSARPVRVTAFELSIEPPNLCTIAEPPSRPGHVISAGVTDTTIWTVRTKALRPSGGTARLVFVSRDSSGEVLVRCERSVIIPPLGAELICSLTAPDSIRYNLLTDTHTPTPSLPLSLSATSSTPPTNSSKPKSISPPHRISRSRQGSRHGRISRALRRMAVKRWIGR
ncbi:MAG: hypothetical protein IPP94_16335 [Ignavibacteria bacterium]|nr:hypothetical protein [Ignavibacteria bacterium]